MRRFLPLVIVLALAARGAPRAAADGAPIAPGGRAKVAVVLRNLTSLAAEEIRVDARSTADWLTVSAPAALPDVPPGESARLTLDLGATEETAWGEGARVEIRLRLRLAGEEERSFLLAREVTVRPRTRTSEAADEDPEHEVAWLLVQGRPGSLDNRVRLSISNTGPAPVRGFSLFLTSSSPDVIPGASPVSVPFRPKDAPQEDADPAIPPGGSRAYDVLFAVDDGAPPGGTAVLSLRGRAGSRIDPRVYQAEILVAFDAGGGGGVGNFEGFARYNLPPPPGGKALPGPAGWLPVPRGTEIKVSQVYEMPGVGGVSKPVEQFVGYGHVLDERGYFRLALDPVGRPPLRLRLVAETLARHVTPLPNAEKPERYEIGKARAAVAPQGRRPWRVISPLFRAVPEAGAGGRDPMLVPEPGSGPCVIGKQILLPYHGYLRDLAPGSGAEPGILIDWEGELSTGGVINFFATGDAFYSDAYAWASGVADEVARTSDVPGLLWHNHPGLLHVLAQVIRTQDAVAPFLPPPAEGEDRPRIPPAIAVWRPGRSLAPAETGYWLRDDGVWRLEVNGGTEDPDESDGDLVARAYGGAVRRALLEKDAPGAKPLNPAERRYRYDALTTPERAFALGFDTFLACVATRDGRLDNEHAADEALRAARSLDLNAWLAQLQEAEATGGPEALRRPDLARRRGLGSPAAVAAGLWLAWRAIGDAFLADLLAPPVPGERPDARGLVRFLDLVSRRAPRLYPSLVTLGLAPRVDQVPRPATMGDRVEPAALWITVDAEGMGAGQPVTAHVVVGGVPLPVSLSKEGAGAVSPGTLAAGGRAPLFADGQQVSWQVFVTVGDGLVLPGPGGAFVASVPGVEVGAGGGDVGFEDRTGRRGSLAVPPSALAGPSTLSVQPLATESDAGGKRILGATAYQIPPTTFARPARLSLPYDPSERPVGAPPPTVHQLDPATGTWTPLGGEEVQPGLVAVPIDHASVFALLLDPRPPTAEDPAGGPDPFHPGLGRPFEISFTTTAAGALTCEVIDAEGRVVATPVARERRPAGRNVVSWDGRGTDGTAVPDGEYTWVLRVRDLASREGDPASGRVTVLTGPTGDVEGRVRLEPDAPGVRPSVRPLHGSGLALVGADGAFALRALPPGVRPLEVEAPGYFPEQRSVAVPEGEVARMEEVVLTNRALSSLEVEPAVLRPDAGPEEASEASVRLRWDRACEARVEVVDAAGRLVRRLHEGRVDAGEQGLSWAADDGDGRPRSGAHRVRVTATAGGVAVPQGEARVLVDRGLVVYARSLPRIFSPDGDGFDDVAEVTLEVADAAVLTATVLDAAGRAVRGIARDEAVAAGTFVRAWDGRDAEGAEAPEGVYAVQVEARYATGEASRPARAEVLLDRTPPRFVAIEPGNGASFATGRPTIRARLAPAGDLDPSSLRVKIDELAVAPDAFDPVTGWLAYTPKTALGEGVHVALVYARDLAENAATPEATSFEVTRGDPDRTRPQVTWVTPAAGATVFTPTPPFEARVRDDGAGLDPESIRFVVDGEPVENRVRRLIPGRSGKAWDVWQYEVAVVLFDPLEGRVRWNPWRPLSPGRHVVRLEVADRRGNRAIAAEATFSVVLDPRPPVLEFLEPTPGERRFGEDVAVLLRLSDEGGSGLAPETLRLSVDGGEGPAMDVGADGTARARLSLAAGAEHLLAASVRDRAGNAGSGTVRVTVAADDAPPVVAARPPFDRADPVVAAGPVLLRARVTDDGCGLDPAGCQVRVDGVPVPSGRLGEDGDLEQPLPALPPGRHTVAVTVRDRVGNVARSTWDVRVRRTTESPRIEVTAPSLEVAPDAAVRLVARLAAPGGEVDPASIRVRLDGRLLPLPAGAFDAATGLLEVQLAASLEEGSQHALTIDVTDREGNHASLVREILAR